MNPSISSVSPPFVFALVLRAQARVSLPFSGLGLPLQRQARCYPDNAERGRFVLYSSDAPLDSYVPAKGRQFYTVCRSLPFASMDDFFACTGPTPTTAYCEQASPFVVHGFLSRKSELYAYGLYNDVSDVLVVTNVQNLLSQLPHVPSDWWTYPIQLPSDVSIALNVKRLIPRWGTWRANFASAAAFEILARKWQPNDSVA